MAGEDNSASSYEVPVNSVHPSDPKASDDRSKQLKADMALCFEILESEGYPEFHELIRIAAAHESRESYVLEHLGAVTDRLLSPEFTKAKREAYAPSTITKKFQNIAYGFKIELKPLLKNFDATQWDLDIGEMTKRLEEYYAKSKEDGINPDDVADTKTRPLFGKSTNGPE